VTIPKYINVEGKISDIIQQNPYLLLMFEHFGIFMPFLEKNLKDVCEEEGLNKDLLILFINLFNDENFKYNIQLTSLDANTIISYLKNSHAYYIKEKYPKIQLAIKKMYKTNNNQEIKLVEKFFNDYFDEVKEHFVYENKVVFPYINQLLKNEGKEIITQHKYSVAQYKEHHDDIEEKLLDLKKLLIKYLPNQISQQLRRELILTLFDLEYDLHIHSKIENMILIPLVENMEQNISQ